MTVMLQEKQAEVAGRFSRKALMALWVAHAVIVMLFIYLERPLTTVLFAVMCFLGWLGVYFFDVLSEKMGKTNVDVSQLITVEEVDGFILVKQFEAVLWSALKADITHVDVAISDKSSKLKLKGDYVTIFSKQDNSYHISGKNFDEQDLYRFQASFV